ncbi:DUF3047 domain-containing protein [Thioclava sp. F36-7]|uniref:DUF3047 domain-containing protein n=1 Tax=Thioclava sp. F36-7 TaxID=1915317 RepID=UPI000996BA7D|nr:DUF3047 domain-containing protein [Thioclava sp. F36-7]OOY09585.1 hypothetical protein BMI89_07210 [Thioclava sp. F36-7]
MRRLSIAFLVSSLCAALMPSLASASIFGGWTEQRFSLFSSNDWQQSANGVAMRSDGSVSLIWRALPRADWGTRKAAWQWSVSQSVPPTPLDRKGGDDRDLSLYFVFMPEAVARANEGASIRKLLAVKEARVLMYVWGGKHGRGALLPSPYLGARGKTVVLRPAGTGSHSESVDLARDYQRAFGGQATQLVGLALSGDSDDTDSAIRARIEGLSLN